MVRLTWDGWLNFLLLFAVGLVCCSPGLAGPGGLVVLVFVILISYLGAVALVDLAL